MATSTMGTVEADAVSWWRAALRVTASSAVLALVLEALIFLLATAAATLAGAHPTTASVLGFLSWSIVACLLITYGRTAMHLSPRGMAAAGATAATLGTAASLAVVWVVGTLMDQGAEIGMAPALLTAAWKALEYGALGVAVVLVDERGGGPLAHGGLGLLWGVVFGGGFLLLMPLATGAAWTAGALASKVVTEALFPVGCSLILWWEHHLLDGV